MSADDAHAQQLVNERDSGRPSAPTPSPVP